MRREMTLTAAGLVMVTVVGLLWLGGTTAQAGPPAVVTSSQGVSITVEVTAGGAVAPTVGGTGGTTGGGTGTLAKTGERIALLGGIGLALLGAGVLVRVAAARRGTAGEAS